MRRNSQIYTIDHTGKSGQDNKAFESDDYKITINKLDLYGLEIHTPSITNGDLTAKIPDGTDDSGTGRDTWDNPIEFLFSCISMSVGLGNVWRFPFTAYENGGGAFLIPYIIVLLFIGKPLYFLEMSMGQFSSFGQVKVWSMAPIFKGVGYGAMLGTACVVTYYVSLMAITIYYFFDSFHAVLPWSQCDLSWTEPELCIDGTFQLNLTNSSLPELYYKNKAFPQATDVDNGIGTPHLDLSMCLLAAWTLIFLSLVKGVKSSGKVAYFTAIFPYVVLFILLVRGVTLKGAWDGIKFFITPDWWKILDLKVWYAAVGQCFFSLSTGFGPIVMFASYNPFKHNVYRDAFIISLMDTFTSLLAGFTIFSILGSLAAELGTDVESVVKSGPGLAFISYPDAIAKFDFLPQFFSVLFFLMLFTLGVGSATALTGGIITIFSDQFPKFPRWSITLVICIVGFLIGLIYVTPGGQFMLNLVDYFGANFVIYVMSTLEVIGVCWVYGVNNFCRDIEFMLDIKIGFYWKFCWSFFIPIGLITILIYTLITQDRLTHDGHQYPDSAIAAGWILAAIALLMVPIFAIHAVYSRKASGIFEKIKESFLPTHNWGPKSPLLRQKWLQYKMENQ